VTSRLAGPDAGALIRQARLHSGLTQAELAARAGTSVSTLSKYEHGHKVPTYPTLYRLLRAAGATLRLVLPPPRDPAEPPLPRSPSASDGDLQPVGRYVAAIADYLPTWGVETAWRVLVQFADDFRAASRLAQEIAVAARPPSTGDRRFDAAFAALIEHLCRQQRIPRPAWVDDEDLIAAPVWYVSGEDPETYSETPIAFAKHGVWIHRGAFASV